MSEIEDTTIVDVLNRKWFIRSAKGKDHFVAWGALFPLKARDPLHENENGNVWFQIGTTRDEALENLRQELHSVIMVQ